MEPKTKNIIITAIVIILAIFLIWIMYFLKPENSVLPENNEDIEENTEQPISNLPDTSPEPLSMVQVYFNETINIEPQGAQALVAHGVLLPIFKTIFDTQENPVTTGVKLKTAIEDNGLTYIFNRTCTENDIEALASTMTNMGATIIENNNPLKIAYSGLTFTFNFWLNDQEKSGVEITF